MKISYCNIKDAEKPAGYSHATVVDAGKLVFISGQVGTDRSGALATGLTGQIRNALINVGLACKAAGTDISRVVKSTIYVVNWKPSMMQHLFEARESVKDEYAFPDMVLTLIGVNGLFIPEMLVEIEAIAVI
ncbi:MAG: RidA family protein [Chitinophagaceae bacterium]|nr:RidA family protein [Chitinophagaceae bacterium]